MASDGLAFFKKMKQDMLEQFKDKPNTGVLLKTLAKQLDEVYEFFYELNTLRWLQASEGVQLDGIGDIVAMSRSQAVDMSNLIGQYSEMDDDTYRIYLAYKIHLNTNNCTHRDVYTAIKMFWDKSPIYYSEDVNRPATIFFDTPILRPEDDVSALLIAPKVKAAGVEMIIRATTETPLEQIIETHVGGVAWPANSETTLPSYLPEQFYEQELYPYAVAYQYILTTTIPSYEPVDDFNTKVHYGADSWTFEKTALPNLS